jgi:hypothetical protein
MLAGGRQTHNADGILRGEVVMAKVKNTESSGKLKSKSGKKRKRSVKVDEILQVILKDESITDPDKQMMVCDVLCAIWV